MAAFRKHGAVGVAIVAAMLLTVATAAPLSEKKAEKSSKKPISMDDMEMNLENVEQEKTQAAAIAPQENVSVNKTTDEKSHEMVDAPKIKPQTTGPADAPLPAADEKRSLPAPIAAGMMKQLGGQTEKMKVKQQKAYEPLNADPHLQALLSDPRLVEEMLEEERRMQMLQQLTPNGIDFKPLAMAEYIVSTGDVSGVDSMIADLISVGALTRAEAHDYRKAVEAEYALLTGRDLNELIFLQESKVAEPDYEGDYIPEYQDGGLMVDYYGGNARVVPTFNIDYEDIVQEIMNALASDSSAEVPRKFPAQSIMSSGDTGVVLEKELHELPPAGKGKDIKTPNENEPSAEEQLALLSKSSSPKDKPKQKQDNRTKMVKSDKVKQTPAKPKEKQKTDGKHGLLQASVSSA